MAMSRDRVRFELPECVLKHVGSTSGDAVRKALHEAFGIDIYPSMRICSRTIVCRPSQFARFLILRNEYGGTNSFKELNAELFIPVSSDVMDVSKERNTHSAAEWVV